MYAYLALSSLFSMEPWTAMEKALLQCGGDTSSCPGSYPTTACLEFHIGCRLGRELLNLFLPPVSMEPWTAIKKALPQCDGDTSSCPCPYPMAPCPQCHRLLARPKTFHLILVYTYL